MRHFWRLQSRAGTRKNLFWSQALGARVDQVSSDPGRKESGFLELTLRSRGAILAQEEAWRPELISGIWDTHIKADAIQPAFSTEGGHLGEL